MNPAIEVVPLGKRAVDHSNPNSLSSKMRAKRMKFILPLIEAAFEKHGHVEILDIGGRKAFWNPIMEELKSWSCKITLINIPVEATHGLHRENDDMFTHVEGDACDMKQYRDGQFHIAVSNSVIEHVGGWDKIQAFASELRRVGESFYMQTPAFAFPIEPHFVFPFFHWLKGVQPLQIWLLTHFNLGNYKKIADREVAVSAINAINILTEKQMKTLFPDCSIEKERFFGLCKSYIVRKW